MRNSGSPLATKASKPGSSVFSEFHVTTMGLVDVSASVQQVLAQEVGHRWHGAGDPDDEHVDARIVEHGLQHLEPGLGRGAVTRNVPPLSIGLATVR